MRAIMAVSADGYVARHPKDDMSWLGRDDKAAFRILTGVGGLMACGRNTYECLPLEMRLLATDGCSADGRRLRVLSGRDNDGAVETPLERFAREFPHAWLIGGQSIVIDAMVRGLVDEFHLCRSDRKAFPCSGEGVSDRITTRLRFWNDRNGLGQPDMRTRFGDTTVELWRRHG